MKNRPSQRELEDQTFMEKIRMAFYEGRSSYGARRIKRALKHLGFQMSRRRVGRLLKRLGLCCKTKRKFKTTTDSNHNLPIAPNLLNRNFTPRTPNQCYAGDITYIPTDEGWLYLAVVIDLYSRKVVGWSMDKNMKAKLVNDALLMAVWQRKPRAGLIWHTDRGSQYASHSHRFILKQHGITQSMSRKGNCWDNAVSESFFHTLKTELTHHRRFKSREEAKAEIFEYIEIFYNKIRMHSANDYLSPTAFEK
ncbi:MAG TPA: IS3 family transposase, partial [Candidatus Lambdaproteobacteria bacterium]|nr:IS3 family transposase [Candidatus Lambdaproteobacteria bacterium]